MAISVDTSWAVRADSTGVRVDPVSLSISVLYECEHEE